LWVAAGSVPSAFDGEPTSCLNELIQQIEKQAYPDTTLKRYLETKVLINKDDTGLLPRLLKIEDEIFSTTQQKIEIWQYKFPTANEIIKFETDLVDKTINGLTKIQYQHQQY